MAQQPPPSPGTNPSPTQPPPQTAPLFRSELRLQWLAFGNFFEAPPGQPSETVDAVGVTYRGTYRFPSRTDVYGEATTMKFTNLDRARPWGGRIGVSHDDTVQRLQAYADYGAHRAAFDVGGRTAFGTITTFDVDYSRRVARDWQPGIEGQHQRQTFDVNSDRANTYNRAGVTLRYRGFGWRFTPRIGYDAGHRSVANGFDSYHEHAWFADVEGAPLDRVYAALGYRAASRNYASAPAAEDRGHENRPNWNGYVNYKFTPQVGGLIYFSRDANHSSVSSRSFNTSFILLGATLHF